MHKQDLDEISLIQVFKIVAANKKRVLYVFMAYIALLVFFHVLTPKTYEYSQVIGYPSKEVMTKGALANFVVNKHTTRDIRLRLNLPKSHSITFRQEIVDEGFRIFVLGSLKAEDSHLALLKEFHLLLEEKCDQNLRDLEISYNKQKEEMQSRMAYIKDKQEFTRNYLVVQEKKIENDMVLLKAYQNASGTNNKKSEDPSLNEIPEAIIQSLKFEIESNTLIISDKKNELKTFEGEMDRLQKCWDVLERKMLSMKSPSLVSPPTRYNKPISPEGFKVLILVLFGLITALSSAFMGAKVND